MNGFVDSVKFVVYSHMILGACMIQNGGVGHQPDSDDSEDDDQNPDGNLRQGPVIQEIDTNQNDGDQLGDAMQQDNDVQVNGIHDDGAFEEEGPLNMFSDELEMNELFNPYPIYPNATGDITGSLSLQVQSPDDVAAKLITMKDLYKVYCTTKEDSARGHRKRKIEDSPEENQSTKAKIEDQGECSGTS